MILMSDTGGGHRASAEALKAGFEAMYGKKYHVCTALNPFADLQHVFCLGRIAAQSTLYTHLQFILDPCKSFC